MEQSTNVQFPRTVSSDNSVWTVNGSQHQLAPITNNEEPASISLFSRFSRKRLESSLTASLLTLLLLIIALMISIYLVFNKSVIYSKVCYSPSCVRSAANILESMNASANPCDNFFKYACGRWRTNHAGPEPYWANSWFIDRAAIQKRDVIEFLARDDSEDDPGGVKDARKVYRACLDLDAQEETGVEYLWGIIDKIGLPRNPLNKSFTPDPWVEILAKTKRYLAMDILMGSGVMASISNSTQNQLVVSTAEDDESLPGWNWERRKFHSELKKKMDKEEQDGSEGDQVGEIWVKYGSRLITYLIEETGDNFDDADVHNASQTILYMIRNISTIQESENVTGSVLNEIPVEMNVTDLQSIIDQATSSGESKLNVTRFFEVLFSEFDELELNFTSDRLLVYKKAYFEKIAEYLEGLDDRDINLFIWWNVVYTLAAHTNDDLRILKENLVKKMVGDFPAETRSAVCMQTVYTLMTQALGYFISQRIEETRISKVRSMVNSIRESFIIYIKRLKWMDWETKLASIDKLNSFNVFVGLPHWMRNRTEFDDLYSNVTLAEDDHFHNVANLLDAIMVGHLESLRTTNDHTTAEFDPLDINAYYDPSANSITVPYGILQFPFYNLGIEALNYGAIGTVLGHEMTHGFDNTGRKYDKFGNVHSWWSDSSASNFTSKTKCYEREYSNFALPNVNSSVIKIDGKLTLGENMADNGGLRFALDAYHNYVNSHELEPKLPGLQEFTHNQLFFLSYANLWCSEYSLNALITQLEDEHSPEFVRVLVVLQNSPEFAETWKCPSGSYMNPGKRLELDKSNSQGPDKTSRLVLTAHVETLPCREHIGTCPLIRVVR